MTEEEIQELAVIVDQIRDHREHVRPLEERRDEIILRGIDDGDSYRTIAARADVSFQRVGQIAKENRKDAA